MSFIINPFRVGVVVSDLTEIIVWQNKTNVVDYLAVGGLEPNTAISAWDGHAYSQQQKSSGTIKAQFKPESSSLFGGEMMIGLINATAALTAAYTDLPYAILFYHGDIYSVESGSVVSLSATAVATDTLSVELAANGKIQYRKNTTLLSETASPTLSYPLKAMSFFQNPNGNSKMSECRITIA